MEIENCFFDREISATGPICHTRWHFVSVFFLWLADIFSPPGEIWSSGHVYLHKRFQFEQWPAAFFFQTPYLLFFCRAYANWTLSSLRSDWVTQTGGRTIRRLNWSLNKAVQHVPHTLHCRLCPKFQRARARFVYICALWSAFDSWKIAKQSRRCHRPFSLQSVQVTY